MQRKVLPVFHGQARSWQKCQRHHSVCRKSGTVRLPLSQSKQKESQGSKKKEKNMTDNINGLNFATIAALMAGQILWEEEMELLERDGHLLGDNLDLKTLQTGFMLGVVRALDAT